MYILKIKESNDFYNPLCTPVAGSANPWYILMLSHFSSVG